MKQLFFILSLTLFLYSFKEVDKKSRINFVTSTEESSKESLKDTLKVRTMVFADFFSPNGDGFNDFFTILNVEDYPGNNIKIVNRWGEVVFKAGPYNNDWNGKNNVSGPLFGNECQDGVYFFEFYDGQGTTATGKITLKR
jgi:gliding motility-associated-like protein